MPGPSPNRRHPPATRSPILPIRRCISWTRRPANRTRCRGRRRRWWWSTRPLSPGWPPLTWVAVCPHHPVQRRDQRFPVRSTGPRRGSSNGENLRSSGTSSRSSSSLACWAVSKSASVLHSRSFASRTRLTSRSNSFTAGNTTRRFRSQTITPSLINSCVRLLVQMGPVGLEWRAPQSVLSCYCLGGWLFPSDVMRGQRKHTAGRVSHRPTHAILDAP